MIHLRELNKNFREFQALKDINLHIKKGETLILNGVSGSGKSTLLSLIAALQRPSSGEILIEGEPISKLPEFHASNLRLKKIGYTPQDFKLIETLDSYYNISLPLIALGLNPKKIEQRVEFLLKSFDIQKRKNSLAKDLSGGEKQRVAIARSLANNPAILLFDEPTANLDHSNSQNFIKILKELKKEDKTIVIATHDPIFDSLEFIDRVVHIKDGEIVE